MQRTAGEGGTLGRRGADLGRHRGLVGCQGPGQVFGEHSPGRKTEILKNWKPDIILGNTANQDFRISGFHHPDTPEILPMGPAGEGIWAEIP